MAWTGTGAGEGGANPERTSTGTVEGEFECDRPAVPISDKALYATKVPMKKKNTARRVTTMPRDRLSDYNLYYFNLWWRRMEVESRKELKESQRREEEARKTRRKRKLESMVMLGRETQQRAKLSPAVFSETDVQLDEQIEQLDPFQLSNYLRVGEETLPGVTTEGVGVMVPAKSNYNITERAQDPGGTLMTQFMDGTRDSAARTELELRPNCRSNAGVEEELTRKGK